VGLCPLRFIPQESGLFFEMYGYVYTLFSDLGIHLRWLLGLFFSGSSGICLDERLWASILCLDFARPGRAAEQRA